MRAHEAGALHGDIGSRGPALAAYPRRRQRAGAAAVAAHRDAGDGRRAGRRRASTCATWRPSTARPAYVLDEDDLRARCRDFRGGFAGADVYYAGKAFLCKAVVRIIAEEGLFLDVCTGGELAIALAAGMPPERIGLHGNNKSVAELTRARRRRRRPDRRRLVRRDRPADRARPRARACARG